MSLTSKETNKRAGAFCLRPSFLLLTSSILHYRAHARCRAQCGQCRRQNGYNHLNHCFPSLSFHSIHCLEVCYLKAEGQLQTSSISPQPSFSLRLRRCRCHRLRCLRCCHPCYHLLCCRLCFHLCCFHRRCWVRCYLVPLRPSVPHTAAC